MSTEKKNKIKKKPTQAQLKAMATKADEYYQASPPILSPFITIKQLCARLALLDPSLQAQWTYSPQLIVIVITEPK